MPLIELMVTTGLVDVRQNLIVQHDRPLLVVRTGEKLDHLPPWDLWIIVGIFIKRISIKI